MSLLEFLIVVYILADVVCRLIIFVLLRDALHTLIAQGNLRRQWVREEHQP